MMTQEQVTEQMQAVFDALKDYVPAAGSQLAVGSVIYFQEHATPTEEFWAPCDGAKLKNKDSKLNGIKLPKLENHTDDAGAVLVPWIVIKEQLPPKTKAPADK